MKPSLFFLCIMLTASCGPRHPYVTLEGSVSDSLSGERLGNVRVSDMMTQTPPARSDDSGRYVIRGIPISAHSIRFEHDEYNTKEIVFTATGDDSGYFLDVVLNRSPDTAYTIHGPIDATFLLSDSLLQRKKLSKNEAKRIVLREIKGGKILGADLVREDRRQYWMFDIQQGKNIITVVLDAFTGKIISVESSDYRSTDDW